MRTAVTCQRLCHRVGQWSISADATLWPCRSPAEQRDHDAGRCLCRKQHHVDCPCLVMWADSDTKMGVQLLRGIDEVVTQPEVHILKNSSHWLQQDKCGHALLFGSLKLQSSDRYRPLVG